MEIHLEGQVHRVTAARGVTLLEAGLSASLPMPYSCTVGGCGTCLVRLLSGEVRLEEPNCLSQEERASGMVLACVSRPLSAVAVEVP